MKFDYKNPLWIIIGILVIAGGLYIALTGLPEKHHEEPVEIDTAYETLEQVAEFTGVPFSKIKNSEIPWRIGGENNTILNMMISGKSFSQAVLDEDQRDSVYFFFTENDWQTETYIADMENINRITGYEKEGMVCLIEKGTFTEGGVRVYSETGLVVMCGINPQYTAPEETEEIVNEE
jgi:hypothetical protein